jgi:hypothetical protein
MSRVFSYIDKKLSERVIVQSSSDLSGILDSTKEYFIDGIVDMGTQIIEVPAGGLNLTGFNFNLSRLISSAPNYTMFTSPVGGSGDVIGKDYAIEVTGTNSQVYNITSATGFDAFEFARINYNNCTSLGIITDYRQGLEVGTGRFGGMPTLTLAGTWVGGFFIDTSIIRGLDAAMTGSLFEAGAGFSMQSRFRSNQNIDLPANASFFDFSPSQFPNPSTVQIEGAIITRNGIFNAIDTNYTPNMTESDLSSKWKGNNGMPNTLEGGSVGVATESVTTIALANTFYDIEATAWSVINLQHFDNPAGNELRHLGNTPREFKINASLNIDSNANDVLVVKILKWDDSASSFITVLDQIRQVNNFAGGRDVAFFTININVDLDRNDFVKLQVENQTGANNITLENDSYYIVEER